MSKKRSKKRFDSGVIVGVDIGTGGNLGIAITSACQESIELFGYAGAYPHLWGKKPFRIVGSGAKRLLNSYDLATTLLEKIKARNVPQIWAFEEPPLVYHGPRPNVVTYRALQSVKFSMELALARHDIPYIEIAHKHIKLVFAGSGNARKPAMVKAACDKFDALGVPEDLDPNVADAVGAAFTGWYDLTGQGEG